MFTGTEYFNDPKQFNSFIGGVSWDKATISDSNPEKEIHGFPTSATPITSCIMYKRNFHYLQKVKSLKSLYCAGYYIIKFDKGWVRSFCQTCYMRKV